jgi:protein-tyrosine phosphatase
VALTKTYLEFITPPSANTAFRQLFVELSQKKQLPSLYHCTTGKDRTGWASAALLTLLGVPEDKVYEDFLRSNEYIHRLSGSAETSRSICSTKQINQLDRSSS